MESDLTIFTWLFSQFDALLRTFVTQKSADVIASITPTAWTMFGIYIVLWGFSMIRGLIDEPVTDGLFRLLRISIVLGFALNVGLYQSYVADFFMQTPDALADVLVLGQSGAATDGQSTFATLDKLLNKTIDTAGVAYDQMSAFSPGQAVALSLCAGAIMVFGMAFTVICGVMILLSKITLVMLLALGPIFVLLAMFPTTQRFFEAWIGQVITAMLTIVFLLAAVSVFFFLSEAAIDMATNVMESDPLQAVGIVGIACVTCTWLLFFAPGVAGQISSGLSLPVNSAAKKLSGISSAEAIASTAQSKMARKVVSVAAAKATGGASIAASTAGQLFRATNTIRRS